MAEWGACHRGPRPAPLTGTVTDPIADILVSERPWGQFTRFACNTPVTVKIITVEPGQRLSLQRHELRGEPAHPRRPDRRHDRHLRAAGDARRNRVDSPRDGPPPGQLRWRPRAGARSRVRDVRRGRHRATRGRLPPMSQGSTTVRGKRVDTSSDGWRAGAHVDQRALAQPWGAPWGERAGSRRDRRRVRGRHRRGQAAIDRGGITFFPPGDYPCRTLTCAPRPDCRDRTWDLTLPGRCLRGRLPDGDGEPDHPTAWHQRPLILGPRVRHGSSSMTLRSTATTCCRPRPAARRQPHRLAHGGGHAVGHLPLLPPRQERSTRPTGGGADRTATWRRPDGPPRAPHQLQLRLTTTASRSTAPTRASTGASSATTVPTGSSSAHGPPPPPTPAI